MDIEVTCAGLAKLLLLEKLTTPEARQRYKGQQRLKKMRPPLEQKSTLKNAEFDDEILFRFL